MFTFLTRMGRLFVGITVFVAVLGVLGIMTTTGILVASHHNASGSSACSLTGTSVGGSLTLSGGGYAANTSYAAEFQWPNGTAGSFPANSTANGTITVSTYAWWAGTYRASVYTTGNHTQLMSSCSITIS